MAMVENSFDWWRKDMFFSAAEEVQESADIMESVYRLWERERRDGFQNDDPEEMRRELQTALGITKWQLEEFEKAVKLSYQKCFGENTVARHRQFVVAIEAQISRIEKALSDSLIEEGKQPLRWVQLDEDERDDLAMFLSAPSGTSENFRGDLNQDASSAQVGVPECVKGYREVVTISQDAKYVVELEAKVLPTAGSAIESHGESLVEQRETGTSSEVGAWKIVIADEDMHKKSLEMSQRAASNGFDFCGVLKNIELTAKLRWFRNSFRKVKYEENLHEKVTPNYSYLQGLFRLNQGLDMMNDGSRGCSEVRHFFRRAGGLQRQVQWSQGCIKFNRPFQVAIILMLTIFLIAPFLVHAY